MTRSDRSTPGRGMRAAVDELRFGAERTLALRAGLSTVDAAVSECEAWLRARQVDRAGEVLVIAGRGRHAAAAAPLRQAIRRLLRVLKRRGVIDTHREPADGSFVVRLAPVQALWEAPRRTRARGSAIQLADPDVLSSLDDELLALLRRLA